MVADVRRHATAGRPQARREILPTLHPNGRLDVVFTIDEGEKTGVKTINFVGNQAYSSGKLRDLMQTTEMNYLSFFKTSDVYDPDRIEIYNHKGRSGRRRKCSDLTRLL